MLGYLRQSTADQSRMIGPFLDDVDGKTPEEALALGKAAGVTRLEPVVRQTLGLE